MKRSVAGGSEPAASKAKLAGEEGGEHSEEEESDDELGPLAYAGAGAFYESYTDLFSMHVFDSPMQIEESTADGLITVTCSIPKPAVFCKDDMHELSPQELAMAPGWAPKWMDELSDERDDLFAFEPTITLHSTACEHIETFHSTNGKWTVGELIQKICAFESAARTMARRSGGRPNPQLASLGSIMEPAQGIHKWGNKDGHYAIGWGACEFDPMA